MIVDLLKSLHRSRQMCEWNDFTLAAPRMRDLLKTGKAGQLPPFLLLSVPDLSAREQRACSELWTRDRRAESTNMRDGLAFDFNFGLRDRIRIAYLSNDFHDHATLMLLIETFEAHDPSRFELHAFSFGADDGKTMRQRIHAAFHVFHDVSALNDAEVASAIHEAGIDILIDLKGYTQGARTAVLMLHPAPVQVNYLGYPGTLGDNICDYIITDPFVTPLASEADYSESFAYMPHSYQPHGCGDTIGCKPTRAEAGLAEAGFVFCCFNQAFKFTPPVFDLWCRLLDATPNSVLWLLGAKHAEGNLRGEALRRGVDPNRLIFAPRIGQRAHLGRLQLADLVLDTMPYGAHTTASDALWAGVPIVTCAGGTFASRVAGSLLHAVGLAELIATNEEDYFAIALTLAKEPEILAKLKATLKSTHLTAPLFDVIAYTHALESLYETMWSRCRVGSGRSAIWA